MWQLKLYKILSFVLLPIGALFGVFCLFSLLLVMANFSVLLPLFIVAATVIYIFSSFTFLYKAILQNIQCKESLKDLIKVNAYVTILFASMCTLQFFTFKSNPHLLNDLLNQAMEMQKAKQMPTPASTQQMFGVFNGVLYCMLVIAVLLFSHITLTFAMLKRFSERFDSK